MKEGDNGKSLVSVRSPNKRSSNFFTPKETALVCLEQFVVAVIVVGFLKFLLSHFHHHAGCRTDLEEKTLSLDLPFHGLNGVSFISVEYCIHKFWSFN